MQRRRDVTGVPLCLPLVRPPHHVSPPASPSVYFTSPFSFQFPVSLSSSSLSFSQPSCSFLVLFQFFLVSFHNFLLLI